MVGAVVRSAGRALGAAYRTDHVATVITWCQRGEWCMAHRTGGRLVDSTCVTVDFEFQDFSP